MKINLHRIKIKALFMIISAMLFFTSSTVVYSQMVTPNLRINDADVDNMITGSRSLAVVEDNVYVVWVDDRVEAGNIYFSKSEDGGETFSDDIILSSSNDENLNIWPAIVADEAGGVYVTWTGFTGPEMGPESGVNVWFTKSTDKGESFDTPLKLTDNDLSLFPSLGVYDNYVYILYGDAENAPFADYYLIRSIDGGDSFQDPIQVNDEACIEEVAYDNFTSIDIDPLTGNIYLAWVDGRREDSKGDIFFAKSTDNGVSIGDNVMVNDPDTDWANFEMFNIVVTAAEENMVYVGYVVEDDDYSRTILSISEDGGNNFIIEDLLAENDSYCYHYDIMALHDGTIGALMVTNLHGMGWNIWFAQPDGSILIINDTNADFRQPSLFLDYEGYMHSVWVDDREGQNNIYYARTKEFEALGIPYFENFNDVNTSSMPPGWIINGEGDFFVAVIDWGPEPYSPPNHLQLNPNDQNSTAVAILPEFKAENAGLALNFKARWNIFGHDTLEIGVITDVDDISTFELVDYIVLPDNNHHNDYIVFFKDYQGEEGHIAFRFSGSKTLGTGGDVYIDNIYVFRAFCFELAEIPLYEDFDDLTPPALPECWITNINKGGKVYTTNDPHYSPPNSAIMIKAPNDEPYFITPPLDANISDLKISFDAFADFVAYGEATLEIGTMSNPIDNETFNPYTNITVPEDSYQGFEIKFDNYQGDDKHIALRLSDVIETQDVDVSIDNIIINYYIFTLTLSAEPEIGGSISGEGEYNEGEIVTINATPNSGYKFVNWTGDVEYIDDPELKETTLTMPDADVSLTANFIETTSISDKKVSPKINIFPNPANQKFTIESDELIKQVKLFDVNGQMVKNIRADAMKTEIQVINIRPGTYFMQIQTANEILNRRVQVVR